jgi:molybdopterin-containing oxidoreductase family membrane subunit
MSISILETNESKGLKKLFWALGIFCFLLGFYGWYDRFVFGHLHANYGSIVTWGLWIAAYIYFIGLSAGSFLVSSLVYVFNIKGFEKVGRLAIFTALITLIMALLSVWADLGHEFRAWHVMVYPNFKSPMAWMIYLYSFYFLLILLEFYFINRKDFIEGSHLKDWRGKVYRLLALRSRDVSAVAVKRDYRIVKILATIGVPVAIMFHGGVGALFGVIAARPHWHSGLFPILFLLSALVSGGALLTMISIIFQDGYNKNKDTVLLLGKLVLGLLILDVIFQVSEFLIAFRGGIPGHIAGLKLVLSGKYWPVFWIWQVFLGTVMPIVILASKAKNNPIYVGIACLLIFIGIFGLRLNIVIPGLAVEEIKGLATAVTSARASFLYFPSLAEWMLTIGIAGLGMLMFGLGEILLPKEKHQ